MAAADRSGQAGVGRRPDKTDGHSCGAWLGAAEDGYASVSLLHPKRKKPRGDLLVHIQIRHGIKAPIRFSDAYDEPSRNRCENRPFVCQISTAR
jgi:hypothetical protein